MTEFERIYREHFDTVYGFLMRLCRSAPLAETDSGLRIEDSLLDQDQAMTIHEQLHALPEPYKEVFTLRVFGELDYAQIARLFGKTESWARVTYHRAKMKLIEAMKDAGKAWRTLTRNLWLRRVTAAVLILVLAVTAALVGKEIYEWDQERLHYVDPEEIIVLTDWKNTKEIPVCRFDDELPPASGEIEAKVAERDKSLRYLKNA